ncbi:MAG: DUF4190 domain-containing protein [Oscillospiraceae bacterium]|nr:DUF4190 domain-containing protein [Oscillospiraceae bacterium]
MDNMNNNYNNQNGYQQDKYPQQNYPQGTYQQTYYQQDMYQQPYNQGNLQELDNKATMAMVFGIIGIFFAGIVFGILALVNANACKKAGFSNGKVTAGFVLGIIDLAALVVYTMLAFVVFGSVIMAAAGSM